MVVLVFIVRMKGKNIRKSGRHGDPMGAPKIHFEEMEARVLFSATAFDSGVQDTMEKGSLVQEESILEIASADATITAVGAPGDPILNQLNQHAADVEANGRTELVFISAGIYDETYLARNLSSAYEVHRIDPGSDALSQISGILSGRDGIDALHLIGHGEAGRLFLGDTLIEPATMSGGHADALRQIGLALSESSDILIYGCDFAAGEAGRFAIERIAELTGADVAASTDATGAAFLGGDWELEQELGLIEAAAISLPGFGALLAPPVWSIAGSSSVTEGSSASYTVSLAGAVQSGSSVSVNLGVNDLTTTAADRANFVTAVNAAVASRSDLSFDGTTLTYAPPVTYTATLDTSGSSYSNISSTSGVSSHNLGDDASVQRSIGFNFDFYGTTYSQIFIGSNGFVTFGAGSSLYENTSFAAGGTIGGNPAIAPLWDDWNPAATTGTEVFSIVTGTAGSRQLIVQWSNIVHYGGTQTASFQLVLNESDGSIEFRYLDVTVESNWTQGSSATIGLSDGSTRFNQYSFNTASIANNQRIVYSRAVTMAPLTITLGTVNDTTPEPSESFQVVLSSASNSTLGTASVTTTIVDNDPAPPVTVTDTYTVAENASAAVLGNVLGNDSDPNGDTLTATVASGTGSQGGLFSVAANGQVTFNPNGQFENLSQGQTRVTTFNYTANDGNGGSTVGQISVTVQGANDAPVASGVVPAQASQDGQTITPLNLSGFFSDFDALDTLTFSATGLPPGLSIHPSTGIISGTLTASASSVSTYAVIVTAQDPYGLNASRSFNWNVTNPAPVAVNDSFAALENAASAVVGNVITNDSDPDNDALSVTVQTAVSGNNGGLFWIAANGAVTFDPNGAFENLPQGGTRATSVTYTLVDAGGATATGTVTVVVTGQNDAPVTTPAAITVNEASLGTPLGIPVPTDVDAGATLTATITGLPAVGTVKLSNGTAVGNGQSLTIAQLTGLIYDAPADLAATTLTAFTYTVSDGIAAAVPGTVSITVDPVNDAPVAVNDGFVTQQEQSVVIDALGNDVDVDGDLLTITAVDGFPIFDGGAAVAVLNGEVTLSGGVLYFTPADHYQGAISFSYTVSDGVLESTATITGSVTAVTKSVTIANVSAAEDGTLTFAATLDKAVAGGFTLNVATVSGTAISGVDFTALSTTLTFAGTVGETVYFTVTPINDNLIEADEFFTVVMSGVSNPTVTITGVGTGTIVDDDARLDPSGPGTGVTTDIELVANGSGGFDLVIEDVDTDSNFSSSSVDSDSNDNLLIYRDGSDFVIQDLSGLGLGSPIVGATRAADNEIRVPVSLVTGNIVVRMGTGSDTVTIRNLGTLTGGLVVDLENASGRYLDTDTIHYEGGTVLAADSDVLFRAETISLLQNSAITTAGSGGIALDAGGNVVLGIDSNLTSGAGDITLEANLDGVVAGRFQGIVADKARITSATGDVRVEARGGTLLDRNFAIHLKNGSVIETGGSIEVTGTGGGNGSDSTQLGVLVTSSQLRSTGTQGVTVRGTGGNGTQSSVGVTIEKNSLVDAGAGDILIEGTGGNTGANNHGVAIAGSTLNSNGGDIALNGLGRGATGGIGVSLGTAVVRTNASGGVSILGTGASGISRADGVRMQSKSSVSAVNGNILIEGTSNGTGATNAGVAILGESVVTTATGSGDITVRGTGGFGKAGQGLVINSGRLTVNHGDLTLRGTGRGTSLSGGISVGKTTLRSLGSGNLDIEGQGSTSATGGQNVGISGTNSSIRASGSGTVALRGYAGTGTSLNEGVRLAGTEVRSATGITIAGTAGGNDGSSAGVALRRGTLVAASGSGTVQITGTGSGSGSGTARLHRGIEISASQVSTQNGNLVLSGVAGGANQGTLNHGIVISSSTVRSTGSGNVDATGLGRRTGTGILVAKSTITSAGGDIDLTGTGGLGNKNARGLSVVHSTLRSTGGGDITARGNANPNTTGVGNAGAFIDLSTLGTTGQFRVIGTGGGGAAKNHGVYMNKITRIGASILVSGTKTDGSSKSFNTAGNYFA